MLQEHNVSDISDRGRCKNILGDIQKRMPKPEIGAVGATFAESDRHHDAYSHLLEILGLNEGLKT